MRRALDFYPTAAWATEALLERVKIRGRVLEPCCGAGDITRELGAHMERFNGIDRLRTNDLDVHRPADEHCDATDGLWWRSARAGGVDWVVTNPPFGVASQILPHAYDAAELGVAMLLRLSYLEPCEGRAGWLAAHPPDKLIVLPRISFTGDGNTDMVTCAWFIWCHDPVRDEQRLGVLWPAIEIVPPPSLMTGLLFNGL